MERIKRQPVDGNYCSSREQAEENLAHFKKIATPERAKAYQIFDVTWARVWKFWVGTKESFQHEVDIYNAKTLRRKNGTHVNNSEQKNRVVNPAQKAKEERRKFNEQIKLESEKIKDEIVKVKNVIKTLKTFLKKKNQALPQLPEIDWINVPLRFKEEYETIYNKAKEKLEN